MHQTPGRGRLLANALLAGALLFLNSLQTALAQQPPPAPQIEEGWELPRDIRERLESPSGSRLDIPSGAATTPGLEKLPAGDDAAPPPSTTAPSGSPASRQERPQRRHQEPWCWKGNL